jgi:archaeosine synthase
MTRYFEVQQRDGAARIGKLILEENIQTPFILETRSLKSTSSPIVDSGSIWGLGSTKKAEERIAEIRRDGGENKLIILPHQSFPPEAPDDVAISISNNLEFDIDGPTGSVYRHGQNVRKSDMYIMEGAGSFENNARKFFHTLLEMKAEISPDNAIYLPNIATPENIAMLAYLGADVFDNTRAIVAAHNDIVLTRAGRFYLDALAELPCRCEACSSTNLTELRTMAKKERASIIERHNINEMEGELALVREKIRAGTLREYLEGQCRVRPWLTALLRIADNEYKYLEERNPIVRANGMIANSTESLSRVEVVRFAERVLERYRPPEADVLVLLPCSAKKPYSISNSHWKFINAMGKNRKYLQEMIITSPLGIVPRELELTYPAAHYDTAVTGYWDAEEKEWVASCLERYLEKNKYKTIIAHVEDAYKEICEIVCQRLGLEMVYTSSGSVASPESLRNLRDAAEEHCTGDHKRSSEERKKDIMRAVADYQFGRGAGDVLVPEGSIIKSPFPKYQVFVGKTQLATLIPQYGTLAITIEGTELMQAFGKYIITIDDFTPKGSLLAPGVVTADPDIRPNDEVFIQGKKAVCVGRAVMSGAEMQGSSRGVAVDLRHVKKLK